MFSREEIALLAQCERDMDSGKMPFVVLWTNIRQSEPIGITVIRRLWRTFWRWSRDPFRTTQDNDKLMEDGSPGYPCSQQRPVRNSPVRKA